MLQIKQLSKRVGNFHLKDINLDIKTGEYFVILGATGTGKTLLLEIIAGMYEPDCGEIWFQGRKLNTLYPEEREIGFVYQDYALFPHLTIKENILFPLTLRKLSKAEIMDRFKEIGKIMSIEHLYDRYPGTLSGGEQQRAALARALIISPRLLLLDEPLSSLDPRTKELIQEKLREIHHMFRPTVIHITHDFSEAISLAERIAVVHNGTIVQVGTTEEIFRRPKSRLVAHFVGMENIFSGISEGDKIIIQPDVVFRLITERTGQVTCAVRPDDIILSKTMLHSSARNSFQGIMTSFVNRGSFMKIIVDIGIPLTVVITAQSFHEMNLKKKDAVWATFKSAAIHVF